MKICPQCRKTYDDATLNFCLDDGTVLTLDANDQEEVPNTLEFNEPPSTNVNEPFGTQQNWANKPTYQADSGGSKTWVWAVGILLGGLLLCGGGGFLSLVVIGVMTGESESPPPRVSNSNTVDKPDTSEAGKLVESTDFSNWEFKDDEFITTDNSDGKLVLKAKSGYFYVFVFKDFPNANASAKITVKNNTGKRTKHGYGLVVNSDPNRVLKKDYAFVIRSDTGRYRVVRHKDTEETVVVNWTRSSAINRGSRSNDIEVRTKDDEMSLYINGKFIRTVEDSVGYNGVSGVYTSGANPITFSDLELRK